MPRVYLSYRRDDAGGYAGWLHEHLADHFGPENIVWDLESVAYGSDFDRALNDALSTCDVLLAVVGQSWMDAVSPDTIELEDYGLREIAAALKDGVPVIPILVAKAHMPRQMDLPEDLRAFARCNAIEMSAGQFAADFDRLVRAVEMVGRRRLWTEPDVVTKLPAPASAFVGREDERNRLKALIESGARLITVTGPGGTGKTRLAVEVARDLAPAFPDGVFFVDLAPLTDPNLIVSAVASALGVREVTGRSLLDSLIENLRDGIRLIVVDNVEHLLAGVSVIGDLLRACPSLAVLATSRRVLRLEGEHVFALDPLSLPPAGDLTPDRLIQSDAIKLFVERAAAAKAGFQLTPENAPAVAAICTQLDGLPLALELAAARLRLFPPHTLQKRLSHRLQTLVGGAQDLAARQQTLRAAIEWSYDLLGPSEQRLLAEMAIFPAGCTLEAVEAVWDGAEDVLEGVESLVEQSLLRQVGEDEPRFTMLETVREFSLEKLGTDDTVRERAAEFFEVLLSDADSKRNSPEWTAWLPRLDAEYDNIRSVLDWAIGRQLNLALNLVENLGSYWRTRGYWNEALSWIERVLGAAEASADVDRAALAGSLDRAGELARDQGQYERAEEYLQKARDIFQDLGDKGGAARTLTNLAITAWQHGQLPRAEALFGDVLALRREMGDEVGISRALNNLGVVAFGRGDYDRARAVFLECLSLQRKLGSEQEVATSLHNLGEVAMLRGAEGEARAGLTESLAIRRRLGDVSGIGVSLDSLGLLEQRAGNLDVSKETYREALQIHRKLGNKYAAKSSLLGLAAVAADRGDPGRAVTLAGAAAGLATELSVQLEPTEAKVRDAVLAACRPALTASAYDTAWALGTRMSWEEMVAFGLTESR